MNFKSESSKVITDELDVFFVPLGFLLSTFENSSNYE
jgi:hypothetical protein